MYIKLNILYISACRFGVSHYKQNSTDRSYERLQIDVKNDDNGDEFMAITNW